MYATKSRALLGELSRDLPARRPGPVSAQALPSGPDSSWESIHRMHVSAIHAAREHVWLMTPYFVPTEAALLSLPSAPLGGLDLRLIVPAPSDDAQVNLGRTKRAVEDEKGTVQEGIGGWGRL